MRLRGASSGCSCLSDFTISCFCLLPRRPFVLRSRPPSQAGRTSPRAFPRRRRQPSSCQENRGPACLPSFPVPLHPVSYLGAVADLVFDCRGPIAHFAPQKDLDRLELEFLRIAPVLPRPAYRLAPLVDSPPQSFTVNFEGPNSCRSTVMPVPSLHLSPKRRPSASAIWLRQEL